MTEEEKKQLAGSKDMQQMLKDQMQKSMQELEERMMDSDKWAGKLRRKIIERRLNSIRIGSVSSKAAPAVDAL